MNDSGRLLSLAWFAVFPVLKTVIRLDSSEHLSPAAFWNGMRSSARRDPGVSREESTWKQFA